MRRRVVQRVKGEEHRGDKGRMGGEGGGRIREKEYTANEWMGRKKKEKEDKMMNDEFLFYY